MIDIEADEEYRSPAPPFAGADERVCFGDPLRHRQQQREGVRRRGVIEHSWRIGQDNLAFRRRRQVKIIVPDSIVCENPALRPRGVEDLTRGVIIQQADHRRPAANFSLSSAGLKARSSLFTSTSNCVRSASIVS
ncbi:MAG TPA: hypothetical protein VN715_14825 [Roseiarcus sp.]|nr:hypothetical protein [Roseiarcus sp.]